MKPRQVALYGGSFCPPHVAHLLAASYALATGLDEVWVAPVYAHRFDKPLLAPFAKRVQWCQQTFAQLGSRVTVLSTERELAIAGGTGATLDLVRHLQHQHPDVRLRLLVGSDVLADRLRWHRWHELEQLAPPLVIPRPGKPVPADFAGEVLPLSLADVSSSDLRERLQQRLDLRGWLHADVARDPDLVRHFGPQQTGGDAD
jgi:nicotinate-nucleotide adenylyltransferase